MTHPEKKQMTLFVNRTSRQWVVRDPRGKFWLLPPGEKPWDERIPFDPTEEMDLEPIPGHYKQMLGLPT